MRETYESLKQMIEEIESDIAKCEAGNKAAGTRVRKAMQEVKKLAQQLRVQVLEDRPEA